jgi:hypothetical protein
MRFGMIQAIQYFGFIVQWGCGAVEVFRILVRIERSCTKTHNISHMIMYRKHQSMPKKRVGITTTSLLGDTSLNQILVGESLACKML